MAELIRRDDNLNQGREKLNESIKQSERAENKADSAIDTSNNAFNVANQADNKSDTTQQQLDNIVIESGTSDAEVIQARGGEDLLYKRLDKTDQQLAQKALRSEVETKVDKKEFDEEIALKRDKRVKIGLDDASSEFLSAIQGGTSVSVLSEPNRNSVTPDTTTFLKVGKNLFNKKAVVSGLYIDGNGNEQQLSNYFTSEFIAVEPGMTIERNLNGTLTLSDKEKVFVSGHPSSDNLLSFEVPEGCYFIRVSHHQSHLDDLQIQVGEIKEPAPYRVYASDDIEINRKNLDKNLDSKIRDIDILRANAFSNVKNNLVIVSLKNDEMEFVPSVNAPAKLKITPQENLKELRIKVVGKNLFNGEWENGFIDSSVTGETLKASASNPVGTSKWIRVKPGLQLAVSGGNRNFWQFKSKDNTNYSTANNSTVTVPEGADYARVYYKNNLPGYIEDRVQIEVGSPSSIENYTEYEFVARDLLSGQELLQDDFLRWYKNNLSEPTDDLGMLYLFNNSSIYVEGDGEVTVSIDYGYTRETEKIDSDVYGIRYEINDSSPLTERIYGSTGLNSNYVVGAELVYPWDNDFDNIYPWSEFKLCNIKVVEGNKTLTYEGEDGFSRDGSNGDVFVEIPRFYSREFIKDGWKHVLISGQEQNGITLDPVFVDGDKELEKIYIGIYEAGIEDNKLISRTNAYPKTSESLDNYEVFAKQKGSGYGEFDWRVMSALQKLFVVEHATRNSSSLMEGYTFIPYHGNNRRALTTIPQSNHIIVTSNSTENRNSFFVGLNVGVSDGQAVNNRKITDVEQQLDLGQIKITFDGDPINVTAGVTQIYGIPQKTGDADDIPYHTGRLASRDSNLSPMKYRHIENLWGNTWTVVSGMYIKNLDYLFVDDSNKYNQEYLNEYTKLSYKAPLQNMYPSSNKGFIKKMGVDNYNGLSLPIEVIPDSPNTYYTDGFYSYNVKDKVYSPVFGGGWDHPWSGVYNIRFWSSPDETNWLYGGRLIYRKYSK